MKKNLLGAGIIALLLFSCQSEANDPVDIAKKFSKAVTAFQFEEARSLATPGFQPFIYRLERTASSLPEDKKKAILARNYTYILISEEDQSALVCVEFEEKQRKFITNLYLKKPGNNWLIDRQENGSE